MRTVCVVGSKLFLALATIVSSALAERVDPIWPTPNTAYFDGKPFTEFIQPTASGEPESGMFGCIRSGGRQFHEGLDLKPVSRDRAGEPKDPVFVVLPGVVRHISRIAGESNYGRYIVVEHTGVSPSVLTLYAHLSAIAPGLKIGDNVERGQTIGTMGRSATGYAIPRDRAHLHFEMAVWLSRDFQSWYNWKKFGSRNDHGVWNGMNITGFDPLDFYNSLRSRAVDDFAQYFARMKPAVRVRIATKVIPDFIERYPALRQREFPPPEQFAGWEVLFNDMALPFSWTPLTVTDLMGFKPNEVRAEPADPATKLPRCKSLVFKRRGRYEIGNDLEPTLQLLFGLRKAL